MRRTARGLTVAVLGSLAIAAPAAADNEITDPCGTGSASLPGLVARDPTVPWLDLCGADVRGRAGSGSLRALRATLRLAGDTAGRAGSAGYVFAFMAGTCSGALRYEDLGPGTTAGRLKLSGLCGGTWQQCDLPPVASCVEFVGGDHYDRVLPATGAKVTGSTVTFNFDPNSLPSGAVPQALLDAFRAGRSLSSVEAFTFLRGQAGTTDDDGVFAIMDDAGGTKPVGLGRPRP
jgi:hypothetical protein